MLGNTGWKAWGKALGLAAGAYGAILATIWMNQEKLLFKPDPFSRLGQSLRAMRGGRAQGRRVREWAYKAPDGVCIQGFISLPEGAGEELGKQETVFYFGGIREEISWALEHAHRFGKRVFVCMNYRGYGLSGGTPEQEKILKDCANAVEMLIEQGQVDKGSVHLIGRSLGSGVASYLSSRVGAKKICLVTPYDSVMSVAKKKYWFIPVGWLFRHPFDAMPWARENDSAMLMLLSERDETVPHEHSQRLFSAWRGKKDQKTLGGTDHSDIVLHKDFFSTIAEFFETKESADNVMEPDAGHEISAGGLCDAKRLGAAS